MAGTFRSLARPNYRMWVVGALVSNIGTWMQRTAQDWLVLTELTHKNATALGVVMALQFGPQALLLPVTGLVADRFERRKILLATQASALALALGLGLLTIRGAVQLWHVYGFALLLGCVTAFDAPARHAFVSEVVSEELLSNAVALNSTSFHVARLIGPAVAGVLIGKLGTGPVFLLNALSFCAVLAALALLRKEELHRPAILASTTSGLADGFRYVWRRRDLAGAMLMLFLVGTLGLNFPVYISTMSVSVFRRGAEGFGLLTSMMAVGSIIGALLSARRELPRASLLASSAAVFGIGLALAALSGSYLTFGLLLAVTGVAAQTFTTTANSTVQLGTERAMRGRVMAIFMAIAMGTTPLGAPLVGWVADTFGPRFGLLVGAMGGLAAALVGFALSRRRAPVANA